MNITTERVAAVIEQVSPGAQVGSVTPLTGGYWASIWRVGVTGQREGIGVEVVVRFAPDATMGAKEAEVQRAAALQGLDTPMIWLSQPAPDGPGWWSVAEFSPGAALLDGLDGAAALRRAPVLMRSLPVQLATATTAVHRLDPAPVAAAVRAVAPGVAWTVPDVIEHLSRGARASGRDDVEAALARMALEVPTSDREVLCHGDIHPFNVLDRDGDLVVLDWTGAVVADPAFDLAYTQLLLASPPLVLPRALSPVVRVAGSMLARRLVASYAAQNPGVSLGHLPWFRALHSARILVEATNHTAAHGPGAHHPAQFVAPAATAHLAAVSGVALRPPAMLGG